MTASPDFQRRRDDVKRILCDPHRVADLLGIDGPRKPQPTGFSGKCPRCGGGKDTNRCSWTRPDEHLRVKCFSCDLGGDVLTVIAAKEGLDVVHDFAAVLTIAAELAGLPPRERATQQNAPGAAQHAFVESGRMVSPNAKQSESQGPSAMRLQVVSKHTEPPDLGAEWDDLTPLSEAGVEYLRRRRLDGASGLCRSPDLDRLAPVLAEARAKLDAKSPFAQLSAREQVALLASQGFVLAMALRDHESHVVGFQLRRLDIHDFRVVGSSNAGLFGWPNQVAGAKNVVVCEGLSDTLAAIVGMMGAQQTAIVGIPGSQAQQALYRLPLKGKRLLIATDADKAGDAAAEAIASEAKRAGARAIRVRPEGAKDIADLHAKGVDLYEFARREIAHSVGFVSASERVRDERMQREDAVRRALPFGVPFLDRAFGGILPHDELLVGAASGVGKTEIAKIIAQHNAMQGRRVFGFFLEADPMEIERRIKFNVLSEMVFNRGDRFQASRRWNFLDWYYGRCNDLCLHFEYEAEEKLRSLRSLHTFYRVSEFSASDFANAFAQISDEADLVLLDHFHYLDAERDGDGTAAQRRAAAKIRSAVLSAHKPLVMVAHVRKSERRGKKPQIVLLGDDFQGASEVWKSATQAVMLSRASNVDRRAPHLWPTYMNPVKLRLDGQRARYCALVDFDASRGCYSDDFELGAVSASGDEFTAIDRNDWPDWVAQRPLAPPPAHWTEREPGEEG